MKIYTKTGDLGQTSLANGRRVTKDCLGLDYVGDLDDLNATIGWVLTKSLNKKDSALLKRSQQHLFHFGSIVAKAPAEVLRRMANNFSQAEVELLEQRIDELTAKLEPLNNFILPGGVELAARLHLARTTCRRAERRLVKSNLPPVAKAYLNRLSDYLFTLARAANRQAGRPDVKWQPVKNVLS